jgi:hypothetical protein
MDSSTYEQDMQMEVLNVLNSMFRAVLPVVHPDTLHKPKSSRNFCEFTFGDCGRTFAENAVFSTFQSTSTIYSYVTLLYIRPSLDS